MERTTNMSVATDYSLKDASVDKSRRHDRSVSFWSQHFLTSIYQATKPQSTPKKHRKSRSLRLIINLRHCLLLQKLPKILAHAQSKTLQKAFVVVKLTQTLQDCNQTPQKLKAKRLKRKKPTVKFAAVYSYGIKKLAQVSVKTRLKPSFHAIHSHSNTLKITCATEKITNFIRQGSAKLKTFAFFMIYSRFIETLNEEAARHFIWTKPKAKEEALDRFEVILTRKISLDRFVAFKLAKRVWMKSKLVELKANILADAIQDTSLYHDTLRLGINQIQNFPNLF